MDEAISTNSLNIESSKRNYSFLHKDQETLDVVEDGDQSFVIPAQPGSCYWAVLRIGYEHHDQPIKTNDFINLIAELMEERDPEKWERFKNKTRVKTLKNSGVVEKDANDWRTRVETNIKTMTRHGGSNPYGNRLRERGHILRWEPDAFDGEGGYVLRTTTAEPVKRRRKSSTKEKEAIKSNT
jgi:hypothetical protein